MSRAEALSRWPAGIAMALGLMLVCAGCASTASPAGRETLRGKATWYGGKLHGGPTASGERFDKNALTAAHRELPFDTRVRVTNEKNGKSVIVRINDRGPFGKRARIIDVSEAAARRLGMIDDGVVPVTVEILELPSSGERQR